MAAEELISPLILVLFVPELKTIAPPVLVLEVELVLESTKPVVMPPGAVSAIAPPDPVAEVESREPAVVLMEPLPPLTERVIFPAVPAAEREYRPLLVMLPPVVESAIVPPFPEPEEENSHPALVSIAPFPPALRVMLLPVPAPEE